MNLNEIAVTAGTALQEHLPRDRRITTSLDPGMGTIDARSQDVRNVIETLLASAADSLTDSGEIIIETKVVIVGDDFAAACLSAPMGYYAMLKISDTGLGMTAEERATFFEAPGPADRKITMPEVYRVIRKSGGIVDIHSSPGLGTAVRILFPAIPPATKGSGAEIGVSRAPETILLVEDEEAVRRYVSTILSDSGYRVLEAATGEEAVDLARNYRGGIHLLLSDIVLPEMSGVEAAQQIRRQRRDVIVLLMSGYPDRFRKQVYDDGPIIEKPFTQENLLRRVRTALDHRMGGIQSTPA